MRVCRVLCNEERGDAAANKGEVSSFHRGEMAEVYLLPRTAVLYPFSGTLFLFLLVSSYGWQDWGWFRYYSVVLERGRRDNDKLQRD